MEQSVAKEVFEVRSPEEIKKGLEWLGNHTGCDDKRMHLCSYFDVCDGVGCFMARDALTYIQQLEAQQPRWISVGEQLPENGQKIIAAFHDSGGWAVDQVRYVEGKFNFIGWVNVCNDNVTHWMPMPLPPEEE